MGNQTGGACNVRGTGIQAKFNVGKPERYSRPDLRLLLSQGFCGFLVDKLSKVGI
jgi:hypothetical protein